MKLNPSSPSKSRVIQVCLFLVRLFLLGIVTLVLLIGIAWALGALWFDFPFSWLRRPLAAVFGLGAIGALAFVRPHWRAQVAVAGAIALVAAWWLTIRPFQYARLAAGGS
jgi:phosphate/sulfate permease